MGRCLMGWQVRRDIFHRFECEIGMFAKLRRDTDQKKNPPPTRKRVASG